MFLALLGERALLERRLEEAHVHLTDIKASWSAQIASLETQVRLQKSVTIYIYIYINI